MIYPSTMAHAMQPGLPVAEAAWRRQVGAPPLPPLAAAAAAAVSGSGSGSAAAPPTAAPPSFRLGGRGGSASLGAGRRLGPGVVARASAAAAAVHSPVSAWALPTAVDSGSGSSRSSSSSSISRGPALGWGLAGGCVGAGNGARAVVAAAARRRGGGGDGGAAAVVAEPIAERIEDTELYDETYKSYLTYAMSVIVSRAIPDVRDGLKPVHRRILYAMHELGLVHNKPFKKCARVVGEVLGKFHPHGDTAVYDSLVRMAQPFAMRSPLVDGHGNFGSLDDDPAAAMRYTECRLTRAAGEALLRDLGPDTVDWQPTFDESQMEPLVLPAVVPNLLVNGSSGIAVGLASNIPPHNLGEVVAALRALIADPRVTTEQLMQHVRGPDFPTGGELVPGPELLQAYATGRGSVVLRGKAFIERQGGGGVGGGGHDAAAAAAGGRGRRRTAAAAAAGVGVGAAEDASAAGGAVAASGGKEQIVITELPYQVFKSDLVAAIAELIESKQLEGASDVRDESDRTGVRVVVEVKRGHSGEVVLAQLYKSTKLQINFNYNCMALLQTKPRQMGLKDMLEAFLDFRCNVVSRRSSASLRSARTRLHLVDGFLRLLREPGRLDAVVADVRAAADGPAARGALVARHGLSEEQAEAILGLTLRRLTGLEADKLEQERAELQQSTSRLEGILADRTALLSVVEQEAAALAAAYPDPRRTALVAADDLPAAPSLESLLPARPCLLLASRRGFLRRLPDESLAAQNRNTRGKSGIRLRSGDTLVGLAAATERDVVLLLTPGGKMFKTRAAHVPASSSSSSSQSASPGTAAAGPSGTSVANILKIPQSFPVAALVPVPPGLMPPPPAVATRRRKAAGAAANGDGAGDDDGGGAAEEAEARDGEEEGEDEEQENVEEEGEEEEDGAAAAAGPCLVLCSRRGLIKRVVLKSRRDSRKGLTIMGLKSGAADEPTTTAVAAAAAEADDADGVAGASGKKRGPRSRSAGGGSGAAPEELGWAALSGSPDDVVALVTAEGHALLFPASDLRPSGPQSGGSLAMRTSRRRPNDRIAALAVLPADLAPLLGAPLKRAAAGGGGNGGDGEDGAAGGEDEDDEVDVQEEVEPGQESEEGASSSASPQQPDAARGPAGPCLLLVTAYGLGKRIPLSHLRLGTRRQSGIVAIRVATADRARKVRGGGGGSGGGATAAAAAVTRGSDRVVAALVVRDEQEVVMASRNGVVVRQSVDGIAVQGRMTRGTFVMQLDDGDEVVDVVAAASTPLEVEAPPPPPPAAAAAAAAVGRGRGRRKAPVSAGAAQ